MIDVEENILRCNTRTSDEGKKEGRKRKKRRKSRSDRIQDHEKRINSSLSRNKAVQLMPSSLVVIHFPTLLLTEKRAGIRGVKEDDVFCLKGKMMARKQRSISRKTRTNVCAKKEAEK